MQTARSRPKHILLPARVRVNIIYRRPPMRPMVTNEENFVPKRRYAPPPPPPTTKAEIEPTTQPTTSPSIDSWNLPSVNLYA
ncbi:unnamed protein product [Cylicocyclus nassatus]|uniref:Uncharacterized protein n=1 Tax=Cylicocyclus nassatus TaxID=53992 RepID=A0AA36DIY1_CYLNA|nr:unnamed protein product [Cylicocyclus nassatus]